MYKGEGSIFHIKNGKAIVRFAVGAGDRGRTDTVSLPQDFESSASANSTTPANQYKHYFNIKFSILQDFF